MPIPMGQDVLNPGTINNLTVNIFFFLVVFLFDNTGKFYQGSGKPLIQPVAPRERIKELIAVFLIN